MNRRFVFAALAALCLAGCRTSDPGDFTSQETALIQRSISGLEAGVPEGTMRVLTIADSADLAVLRAPSVNLSEDALHSDEYAGLCSLMVATVTHPSQDGVGIAGPQVGLNRRVVAVQRFDKPGEPFEVYANVRILSLSDSVAYGPEGCLSVPDMRGEVLRSQEVVIEYADLQSLNESRLRHGTQASFRKELADSKLNKDAVPTRCDTVRGFTAVIFQHEIDHLDGVLYIDRL